MDPGSAIKKAVQQCADNPYVTSPMQILACNLGVTSASNALKSSPSPVDLLSYCVNATQDLDSKYDKGAFSAGCVYFTHDVGQ